MDNLTLGIVLAVLGMGGTLLTLLLLSFVIDLLKRLFPDQPPAAKEVPVASAPTPPAAGPV